MTAEALVKVIYNNSLLYLSILFVAVVNVGSIQAHTGTSIAAVIMMPAKFNLIYF